MSGDLREAMPPAWTVVSSLTKRACGWYSHLHRAEWAGDKAWEAVTGGQITTRRLRNLPGLELCLVSSAAALGL